MATDPLTGLIAFATIAEKRSFTAAAAALAVTPSALSQTVRQLEERLGLRLLQRTTRSVGLTEAGERFLAGVGPALSSIQQTIDEVSNLRERPSGTLRLNVPRIGAELVVEPALPAFMAAFPEVRVEVVVDDARTDIVKEGYDAGIRLGESLDKGMICVRVGPDMSMAVIGSPDYFAAHGTPKHPADLRAHECIRYRQQSRGTIYRWEFDEKGQGFEVAAEGRLTVNDGRTMVRAAIQGLGLGFVMDDYVRTELRHGVLVRVLERYCSPFQGFFLYYPSRAHIAHKLRVFVDFLCARAKVAASRRRRGQAPAATR